jgi:hypothetical protein
MTRRSRRSRRRAASSSCAAALALNASVDRAPAMTACRAASSACSARHLRSGSCTCAGGGIGMMSGLVSASCECWCQAARGAFCSWVSRLKATCRAADEMQTAEWAALAPRRTTSNAP